MNPYYSDDLATVHHGDSLDVLTKEGLDELLSIVELARDRLVEQDT